MENTQIAEIEQKIDTSLVEAIKVSRFGLLQQMDFIVIDQPTSDLANDLLRKVTAAINAIEDCRQFFVKPLNIQVKAINERFKLITGPMEEKKRELSQSLLKWRAEEQRKFDEAQAKVREEEERRRKISLAKGGNGEIKTPVEQPKPALKQDTTKTRKQWTYEIEDESKIPRQYLIVDTASINTSIRNGVRDIPGLKIYQKEIPIFG